MTTITNEITTGIRERVDDLPWSDLRKQLDGNGYAVTSMLLSGEECDELSDLFDEGRFRSTIEMARFRFGDGRYRYFDHPLPDTIAALRSSFYRQLAPVANHWAELMGGENVTFPREHEDLLQRCADVGQTRPTPLILRYGEGDWNALHRDLYGEVFFPLQILTILSRPGRDFEGGQFVLLEQRPRAQSRAHVLTPAQGAFVIFPTSERPNKGKHGYHRIGLRHGAAMVTAGQRTALGVIFHDAESSRSSCPAGGVPERGYGQAGISAANMATDLPTSAADPASDVTDSRSTRGPPGQGLAGRTAAAEALPVALRLTGLVLRRAKSAHLVPKHRLA